MGLRQNSSTLIKNDDVNMKTLLLVACLAIVGCVDSIAAGENRLLYNDVVAREMFIKALERQNISYHVDAAGGVWYPAKDERAISEIGKKITLARFSGPAVAFEDPFDVTSFRKKLTQARIPYKTKQQDGREWTTWEKKDDPHVKEIQEEVEGENMKRAKAEREKKNQKN